MEKPILRINYSDFWSNFDKESNFFKTLLSTRFHLQVVDNPDVLIYSCFGNENWNYTCTKIYYTGENMPTDFRFCDYSITFEELDTDRQYYFPFYALRLIEEDKIDRVSKSLNRNEAEKLWEEKEEFCATVVSNSRGKVRNDFFERLNKQRKVNSGGRYKNNVGGPISDKEEFCSKHKLTFAFENELYPGYTTEKLTDAILSRTVPIYFGDPKVGEVFNSSRFIHYADFASEQALIEEIIATADNKEKWIKYMIEPVFINGTPSFLDPKNLVDFIEKAINEQSNQIPIAQQWKGKLAILEAKARHKIARALKISNLKA